jgi:hypothetical protein
MDCDDLCEAVEDKGLSRGRSAPDKLRQNVDLECIHQIRHIVEDITSERLIVFPRFINIHPESVIDTENYQPLYSQSGSIRTQYSQDFINKLHVYKPLYDLYSSLTDPKIIEEANAIIDTIAIINPYIQRKLTDLELLIRIRRFYSPQRTQEDIQNGILMQRRPLSRSIAAWPYCYETYIALGMIENLDTKRIAEELVFEFETLRH